MPKKDTATFDYEGCDLEAMLSAQNYYRWICHDIRPYLGKSIVEVGSGVGSFSKLLLQTNPRALNLVEPSQRTFDQLKANIAAEGTDVTKVAFHHGYLSDALPQLKSAKPDTFVYINVFEHIEDDVAELTQIRQLLQKGGHAIIFVPALPALMSEFDKSIGHYRRYTRQSLRRLCSAAGLEVVDMHYRDIVGTLSWWLSFVLLKRRTLSPSLVKSYDSLFVPVIRAIESRLPVPIGKNLLLVAKKP